MLRSVSASLPLTAADVERMSIPGKQVELVRGQLVVREPPGTWHGAIAANLAYLLGDFVQSGLPARREPLDATGARFAGWRGRAAGILLSPTGRSGSLTARH